MTLWKKKPARTVLDELADINAAYAAGYEMGLAHGRAAERGLIEGDAARAAAAARAVAISEGPEVGTAALATARAEQRAALGGSR